MKILFHYPGPFYDDVNSAEKKRPKKMAHAFEIAGHKVTHITGSYQERINIIKQINPLEYDFLYSENSNMPLYLATPKHLPIINNKEITFLKNLQIPKGVYYRDVFWIQKEYLRNMGLLKGQIGKHFYKKEISFYKNYFDCVFLQTKSFENQIPIALRPTKSCYLPPGCDDLQISPKEIKSPVKLIYVGSCMPPVYDVIPLFNELNKIKNIEVTIVTRELDQKFVLEKFKPNQHVKILKASGDSLDTLLQEHHIGLMCPDNTAYWDITLPFKFFEYLSFNLPLIGKGENEVSAMIETNKLGTNIMTFNELESAIENIKCNYTDLVQNCQMYKTKNTWEQRALEVASTLKKTNP